ncbi:hypothetical protein C2845_PM01G35370 [Panicum miliaceum]|uniref:Uncharacterized protein n=1 Tax=Panicum miliaceum TaxID=4540 RepID=A0A3L6TM47_PANMI|nr:hypothetical protein C2845_PM01G35370 [Panicum miliaceum]
MAAAAMADLAGAAVAVVSFLQSRGLHFKDLGRIFGMCPSVLTASVRADLRPVFAFLSKDLGVPESAHRRVVVKCPRVLACSVRDQLRPAHIYLRRLGFRDNRALAHCCFLLPRREDAAAAGAWRTADTVAAAGPSHRGFGTDRPAGRGRKRQGAGKESAACLSAPPDATWRTPPRKVMLSAVLRRSSGGGHGGSMAPAAKLRGRGGPAASRAGASSLLQRPQRSSHAQSKYAEETSPLRIYVRYLDSDDINNAKINQEQEQQDAAIICAL